MSHPLKVRHYDRFGSGVTTEFITPFSLVSRSDKKKVCHFVPTDEGWKIFREWNVHKGWENWSFSSMNASGMDITPYQGVFEDKTLEDFL